MGSYRSWKDDCTSSSGTVKVLTKPQHGRLSTSIVDSTIGSPRIARKVDCAGVPIKAFQVDYTSERGFHATDSFVLDATWSNLSETDHYTVMVRWPGHKANGA
jgi:hypothetical protein